MSQSHGRINNGNLKYETEKHVGEMKQGQNNILVAVRVRPLLKKEAEINPYETLQVLDQQVITLIDPEKEGNLDVISRKNRDKSTQFAFDYAFDKMTTQKQIFDCTTSPLIDGVLDGYNCTIFAYGATGAGKTYTMVGTPDDPGIMQRTLNQLYILIGKQSTIKKTTLKASYLEIYNENIKDLLTQDDKNLEIREDPISGVQVINLTEVEVKSTKEIMNLMQTGNRNRTMEATMANEFSSRSHAILQISVEIQERNQGINSSIQQSKLSLVDLAGSERAAKTNNRGIRLIEGAKINQSLLTLGNCIHALAELQEKNISSNNTHIPYRGSKLTRLLKDSLGGNCRTVMISNVSPSIDSVEDTYNTLTYANRAKMIKTNVSRNVVQVESHISNYTNIIDGLRKENQVLKKMLHDKEKMDPDGKNSMQNGSEQRLQNQANSVQDVVKANKQRQMVTQYERELNVHFKEEIDILRQVYEQEQKVEAVQYSIFRTLTQLNQLDNKLGAEAQVLKEKAESQKFQLKQEVKERDEIKEVYKKLKDLRNAKIIDMRQKDLNTSKLGFLMGVYKQGQLMAENQEILFKEKLVEDRVNQKELQIAFLHNQMIARDSVINEQKEILRENNIQNDVNYKYVKSIKQITEEAKLNFPIVNKKMEMVYSMPQLNKKQYVPQKYQKGQQRNNSQHDNIFQQQLNYDEYQNGGQNYVNQNQSIVRQKGGNYGNNGIFHYKKDFSEHKKNANDFLNDNHYKNDKVKQYNDKIKEKRLQQLDYPPNEASSLFPDIEDKANQNKLNYKNGKLQKNDDVEAEEIKDKKKQKFLKNQMNSQQRQDNFLYEFKQKQKQKKLEREGGLRQSSFSDLNTTNKKKDPTIGSKYQQNYSGVYNNQQQVNRYIVNNAKVDRGNQHKQAPKYIPDTESLYSNRLNTPKQNNHHKQQYSNFKNIQENESFYSNQNHEQHNHSHQHGGNQNTVEIIKKLESQAPQRSNIRTKVELQSVLNERKNIDPLAKERDDQGRVNLNKVYKESPYVKSFLQKKDFDQEKIDRFQINKQHKPYVDEELQEKIRQEKIKEQQKIYKSKFSERQKYMKNNKQQQQMQDTDNFSQFTN